LNNSNIAVSCCPDISSTTNTALGASRAKLSCPIVQFPMKSDVLIDVIILSGLSENKIVLSETLYSSSENDLSISDEKRVLIDYLMQV
jgi:hypothetical protein